MPGDGESKPSIRWSTVHTDGDGDTSVRISQPPVAQKCCAHLGGNQAARGREVNEGVLQAAAEAEFANCVGLWDRVARDAPVPTPVVPGEPSMNEREAARSRFVPGDVNYSRTALRVSHAVRNALVGTGGAHRLMRAALGLVSLIPDGAVSQAGAMLGCDRCGTPQQDPRGKPDGQNGGQPC